MDPRNPACRQRDGTPSPAERRQALAAAAAYLRCPVCAGPLHLGGTQLACRRSHGFDIARQGYVNLTAGRAGPGTADTSAMVTARERFLGRGHYQPLAAAVQSLAARHDPDVRGLVTDLAGGTGYYLAGILDALPHRHGVCLDLSVPALRRAARAHPRAAALGADVWQPLPLADRSAALVVSIFGPRNAAETGRVLTPGGMLLIAAPGTAHLGELQRPLGMIGIDRRKPQRLTGTYRDYARSGVTSLNYQLSLDHADLTALVSMGPSVRHITPQVLAARISFLPSPFTVTVDLRIRVFQRPRDPAGVRTTSGKR
ncbi:MAG TPA: methyltransferase type 11 [Streptosporangiaceae bacterium]